MKKLLMFLCATLLCFAIMVGNASSTPVFYAGTGHYYEYVNVGVNWTDAFLAAGSMSYLGLDGYLASVTSTDENNFLLTLSGDGWLGGSDGETEGIWKWMDGPEAGTTFWVGGPNGYSPTFASFRSIEPNDQFGEDFLQIHFGEWNDLPNDAPRGYYVEYSDHNQPVPEPATILLLSSGLICLVGFGRKKLKGN